MRKYLLLLISAFAIAQTAPSRLSGLIITANQPTVTSTPSLTTTEANGLQGKISPVNLPLSNATATALETYTENSAGALSGFALTNNGNGTVNIASGFALLRATNSETGVLSKLLIPSATNLALTDNANNYVIVQYNAGSPNIAVTTDPNLITTTNNTLIYVISRYGTTLNYLYTGEQNVDSNGKLRRRFLNIEPLKRAGGAVLGFTSRVINTTAGLFYGGLTPYTTPTLTSFTNAYNNGTTWTRQASQTQVNNTQYNVNGVLTTMNNGRFRTDFVYIMVNNPSVLYTIMGTAQYNTLADARLAALPSVLPVELQKLGVLVGRLIIGKDATAITEISSAYDVSFNASTVINHNDTGGIQGGAVGDYQHVTAAEKTNWNNKPTLATIAQIRALSGVLSNNYFYTTDIGQEGNWYYDSSDTTTADNTGTVLVTSDGKRIKRIYQGAVNVSWYGIFPNLGSNFSSNFVSILGLHDEIFIPSGTYNITVTTATTFNNKRISGVKPSWNGTDLVNGTVITGNWAILGNENYIEKLGIYNTSGNGLTVRTNASKNTVENVLFDVQDHGVLIEQFGGTASDNVVKDCDAYGGIHGFVSKSKTAKFINLRSFSASEDGFAMVSDNITGVSFPSLCLNNTLINCEAYNTNAGIRVYSRDYSSTTNAANILLRDLSIIGGNIDTCSAYGISVGDDVPAGSVPAGRTYNNVENISISGLSIKGTTTSNIQLGRSNGVYIGGNNFKGLVNKQFDFCKNLRLDSNNNNNFSQGNSIFNTINPVNSTSIDASIINTIVETNNTASTTIGIISNGKVGQIMQIFINDDFTVISRSTTIRLTKYYIRGKGSYVVLKYANDGSGWDELYSYTVGRLQSFSYAASTTIDYKFSEIAELGMTGNVSSIVFTNMLRNSPFRLILKWDNSVRTITGWDSRIIWLGGTAPDSVGSDRIILEFYFDGTNIVNTYRSDILNVVPTATLPTQAVPKSQLDAAARPYKVYTVVMNQTTTSAPTIVTTFENTLGGSIVWTRNGVGDYRGTLTGAFTSLKTVAFTSLAGAVSTTPLFINGERISNNEIRITTYNGVTPTDGLMTNAIIEFRVYN